MPFEACRSAYPERLRGVSEACGTSKHLLLDMLIRDIPRLYSAGMAVATHALIIKQLDILGNRMHIPKFCFELWLWRKTLTHEQTRQTKSARPVYTVRLSVLSLTIKVEHELLPGPPVRASNEKFIFHAVPPFLNSGAVVARRDVFGAIKKSGT